MHRHAPGGATSTVSASKSNVRTEWLRSLRVEGPLLERTVLVRGEAVGIAGGADWEAAWLAELDRRAQAAKTRGESGADGTEARPRILKRLGQTRFDCANRHKPRRSLGANW